MPAHHSDAATVLNTLADLSEINKVNELRVRAWRDAAQTIDGVPRNLSEMIAEGEDLSELPCLEIGGLAITERIAATRGANGSWGFVYAPRGKSLLVDLGLP